MPDHNLDDIVSDIELDNTFDDFYTQASAVDIPAPLSETIDDILGAGATLDITNQGYLEQYDRTGEKIAKLQRQASEKMARDNLQNFLTEKFTEIGADIAKDKFESRLDRFGVSSFNPTAALKPNYGNIFEQRRIEEGETLKDNLDRAIIDESLAVKDLRDDYIEDVLGIVAQLQQSGYNPPSISSRTSTVYDTEGTPYYIQSPQDIYFYINQMTGGSMSINDLENMSTDELAQAAANVGMPWSVVGKFFPSGFNPMFEDEDE
tara:strand:- start:120 stop:908 length:789 start_codon:yes stop_codon:yes gene_type:complete